MCMLSKTSKLIQILMLLLNVTAVIFVSVFIYITTEKIVANYMARQFIGRVDTVPINPLIPVIISAVLMMILVASFVLRETRFFKKNIKLMYLSFAVDFIISLFILFLLNFNYNGIMLFVFANVISFARINKGQYWITALALGIFLMADYELVSINVNLFSLKDYMASYGEVTRQYLTGFYNVLISLNIIMFIAYCFYVIKEQQGTIFEVNKLYEQLSKANQDLQQANVQLNDYAVMRENMGKTKERNRLAMEIHDTLGHILTGISTGIDACITMAEKYPRATKDQLEVIAKVARQGILDVRRSVNELKPDSLARLHLKDAIIKMVEEFNSLTKTNIFFTCSIDNFMFDDDEEKTIYRVIQESITNAMRHGEATIIRITMEEIDSEVLLHIKDNGKGCPNIKPGFGTKHVAERIEMLGGTVEYNGTDGFTVNARIPIRRGKKYD